MRQPITGILQKPDHTSVHVKALSDIKRKAAKVEFKTLSLVNWLIDSLTNKSILIVSALHFFLHYAFAFWQVSISHGASRETRVPLLMSCCILEKHGDIRPCQLVNSGQWWIVSERPPSDTINRRVSRVAACLPVKMTTALMKTCCVLSETHWVLSVASCDSPATARRFITKQIIHLERTETANVFW